MSEEVYNDRSDDPSEQLRTLKITKDIDEEEDEDDASMVDGVYEDDDDDYDEKEEGQEPVWLGFVESPKHWWSLSRELFPSVAGGTPAWLDPINLPSGGSCLCEPKPLLFLPQVYAQLLYKESTFHRTLFVFICPSMSCLLKDQHDQWKQQPEKASRSMKVFRCQLPRFNFFYSSEPPRHNRSDRPLEKEVIKLNVNSPQLHQWLLHQPLVTSAETQKVASNHLLSQFEIVNEDECDAKNSEYDGFDKLLVSHSQMDEVKSLLDTFEVGGDKKAWAAFQERISRDPEQLLRYYRLAKIKPLWPMSSGRPSKMDIPRCSYCGGPPACGFRVLPQLLYYFGMENNAGSLDWATIAVYTCEASCEDRIVYKDEFAWDQFSSQSATTER